MHFGSSPVQSAKPVHGTTCFKLNRKLSTLNPHAQQVYTIATSSTECKAGPWHNMLQTKQKTLNPKSSSSTGVHHSDLPQRKQDSRLFFLVCPGACSCCCVSPIFLSFLTRKFMPKINTHDQLLIGGIFHKY